MSLWRRNRRSLALVGGQVVGQLCLIAIVPWLTRSYEPSILGTYQAAMSLALILQPLASLRTEFVLPSVRYSANAALMHRRAVHCALLVVAVCGGVACGLAAFHSETPAKVAAMVAILTAALVWTVLDNARLVRAAAERRLAVRNALAGFATASLQLAMAAAGFDVLFLAVALLVGRGAAIVATSSSAASYDKADRGEELRRYGLRRIATSVTSGLAATASAQALTFTSAPALGTQASGYIGVAQRVAGVPISLLGLGLSQALQVRSAPMIREGRPGLRRQIGMQIAVLAGVATVLSVCLIALAPSLAAPLLGEEWRAAGKVAAVLAVPLSFQLVIGPLMPLLPMLGREKVLLVTQVSRLVLVLVALAGAYLAGLDLIATAAVFGVASVVGYAVMLVVLWVEVRRFDMNVRPETRKSSSKELE